MKTRITMMMGTAIIMATMIEATIIVTIK